ncbi:hypothetical protein Tco_0191309 [Tanacetum coccineum]
MSFYSTTACAITELVHHILNLYKSSTYVIMQKEFLGSGGGGGNHNKKDGSKAGNDSTSQSAKLDDTVNMVSSTMDDHVVASVNVSNLESFLTVSEVHGIHSSVNVVKSGWESYPPLPNQGTTPARNTPGKSSYANIIGESSKKAVNIHTLLHWGERD